MGAILFRLALLAAGLGLGQMGMDSLAHSDGAALVQFGLAVVLLVAGGYRYGSKV